MTTNLAQPVPSTTHRARMLMLVSLVIIPVNVGVLSLTFAATGQGWWMVLCFGSFSVLALAQLVCGIAAVVTGLRERRATNGAHGLWPAILGGLAALGAPVGWGLLVYFLLLWGKALAGLGS